MRFYKMFCVAVAGAFLYKQIVEGRYINAGITLAIYLIFQPFLYDNEPGEN